MFLACFRFLPFDQPPPPKPASLKGRVFHSFWGYDSTDNTFLVVNGETEHFVIVAELKKLRIRGDDTEGVERPVLPAAGVTWRAGADSRLRKHRRGDGGLFLQQDHKIFRLWDGNDCHYNSD